MWWSFRRSKRLGPIRVSATKRGLKAGIVKPRLFPTRKSVKAGPIRVTASKRGISTSVGARGARIASSSRGRTWSFSLFGIRFGGKL